MRSGIWHQVINGNDGSDWLLMAGIVAVSWITAQMLYRLSNGILKRISVRIRSRGWMMGCWRPFAPWTGR